MLSPQDRTLWGERSVAFNATTSLFNYGALNTQFNANVPMTVLALIRPAGAGEGDFGYILAKTDVSSVTGTRWFVDHNTGSPAMAFGHASGDTNPLRRGPANSIVYGRWIWVAVTSVGTITATDIKLYQGEHVIKEVSSYSTSNNGTGTINNADAYSLVIGNRNGSDRTFNGDIAVVVRWSSLLSVKDLNDAIRLGPRSVKTDKQIFCWVAGGDISQQTYIPATVTARGLGRARRYPIQTIQGPSWLAEIAGGGAQIVSPGGIASLEAFGTTVVLPGAVTVTASGIATAEAFGDATVTQGGVNLICTGIASEEAFGAHTIVPGAVAVVCSGIATAEAFGDAFISAGGSLVSPAGIASLEVFGSHTITPGAVSIVCNGIASLEEFGATAVLVAGQFVSPSGIATAESFGTSVLTVGGVTIVCNGIASLESFGSSVITGGAITVYTPGATWYVRESKTFAPKERRTWTRH